MTKFEKIIKAVQETGADARETVTAAGLYFDGIQHGELIPIIRIVIDKYNHSGRYDSTASQTAREARKAAGKFKGISIREQSHNSYYIYDIMTEEDREKSESLQKKADLFLNAFWQEIHRQNIEQEEHDQTKAVKAGQEAIEAA